tara:strand:+ start:468 stop:1571 length:1104 start_codon:yes stop_codon:yes gene_type:complete
MMKKGLVFGLMIVSMFLLSACDVYEGLYLPEGAEGEAEEVPEGLIKIEVFEELIEETVEEESEMEIEKEAAEETVEEETMEEEGVTLEEVMKEVIVEEEETPEDAAVIIVEETELISLVPEAQDPDNDVLDFTFTSPLDSNGEWLTDYGDNGEYTITVTVSDGFLTASKEVLVIVNKKEEAPVLNSFKPEDASMEIKETEALEFQVDASDMNNDELSYTWKLDGTEAGNENFYRYETTYDDSGSHTVKVAISDGVFDAEKIWAVSVDNVNREPLLQFIDTIEVGETENVVIELDVVDHDEDDISYEINDERFTQDGNIFTWETTYEDAGEYTATVSASDGVDSVSQEVVITVEGVNRPPVILDIVQK